MSDILNFSQFINESFKFKNVKFNSHKNHNPSADIIEGHIDGDTFITYGIYVNGPKKGEEFMEIYTGENYKVGSTKRSHSRIYSPDKIPSKYKSMWTDLKDTYESDYVNESATLKDVKDFSGSKDKILVGLKTNLLKDMLDRYEYMSRGEEIHFFNKGKHFGTLFNKGTRYQELKHDGSLDDKGWIKK
jgi:hypothetical protein